MTQRRDDADQGRRLLRPPGAGHEKVTHWYLSLCSEQREQCCSCGVGVRPSRRYEKPRRFLQLLRVDAEFAGGVDGSGQCALPEVVVLDELARERRAVHVMSQSQTLDVV